MEFDIWSDKKSELSVSIWNNFSDWCLPVGFYLFSDTQGSGVKTKSITFKFLCLGIRFEYWKWVEK
jgi:hypothetical protein